MSANKNYLAYMKKVEIGEKEEKLANAKLRVKELEEEIKADTEIYKQLKRGF